MLVCPVDSLSTLKYLNRMDWHDIGFLMAHFSLALQMHQKCISKLKSFSCISVCNYSDSLSHETKEILSDYNSR